LVEAPDSEAASIGLRVADAMVMEGIFNVQTREDASGVQKLVEVNSRTAGGILGACMSGTNLIYWAAMLAAGHASTADVPPPVGARVILPWRSATFVDLDANLNVVNRGA
jgi:hypothetical protein